MLGYKGQAKPSWIKVFNHASHQKSCFSTALCSLEAEKNVGVPIILLSH